MPHLDRTPYRAQALSQRNRARRLLWNMAWLLLFRPTPVLMFGWRRALLRIFGARMTATSFVYPSTRVWAPWNLTMGKNSCLAPSVDCYCVDRVDIGSGTTVSQYTYLCSASHDPDLPHMPLITAPISIEDEAWVAADVFVGPGVTVGQGAVVGARSVLFKNVPPWTIVAGNPARYLRTRIRNSV